MNNNKNYRGNYDPEHKEWAKKVKQKDNYRCQICFKSENLESHHLYGYEQVESLRYEISNGITLCVGCHTKMHEIFGKEYIFPYQYVQFKKITELFKKLSEEEINASIQDNSSNKNGKII